MTQHLAQPRLTITVEEAGKQLGISRNSAYEAARRGEIPTIRIGRLLRVPTVAFERLLSGDLSKAPLHDGREVA